LGVLHLYCASARFFVLLKGSANSDSKRRGHDSNPKRAVRLASARGIMAKSRRFTRFFRALRERQTQSLPVISKRLTAGLKSILTRKTDQRDLDMPGQEVSDGSPGESTTPLSLAGTAIVNDPTGAETDTKTKDDVNPEAPVRQLSTTAPKCPEKRKYSGEHGEVLLGESGCCSAKTAATPSDMSHKPSTKKQQEIIDWVNHQPTMGDLSTQSDVTLPLPPEDGGAHATFNIPDKNRTRSTDHSQTCEPPSGRTSPQKSHHGTSQDPKNRGTPLSDC